MKCMKGREGVRKHAKKRENAWGGVKGHECTWKRTRVRKNAQRCAEMRKGARKRASGRKDHSECVKMREGAQNVQMGAKTTVYFTFIIPKLEVKFWLPTTSASCNILLYCYKCYGWIFLIQKSLLIISDTDPRFLYWEIIPQFNGKESKFIKSFNS